MTHRRSLSTLALAVALASTACAEAGSSPAASPDQVMADSLIGAWLEAAGGMAAWDDVRSARFTITTVWFDSTGEVRRMRPRRVEFRKHEGHEQARIERPEAEGLYVQTFTGTGVWATLNDRRLPADDPATEESEYVARDVVYWFGLPYKLFDPGVNRSAAPLDGGGYEVRITFGDDVGIHPGDRYFYYFTDDDPYPEEVHYIEQGKGEEARSLTEWKGFGRVETFVYVVDRTWRDPAGRPTKALRVDDVTLNPELPDSLFAPPPP